MNPGKVREAGRGGEEQTRGAVQTYVRRGVE